MTREEMIARIDLVADTVRDRFVISPTRAWEYKQAEIEATQFAKYGYLGNVPPMVAVWVEASGMSPTDAANDIIAAALRFNAALAEIRKTRLVGKTKVVKATTDSLAEEEFSLAISKLKILQNLAD